MPTGLLNDDRGIPNGTRRTEGNARLASADAGGAATIPAVPLECVVTLRTPRPQQIQNECFIIIC